MSAVVLQCFSLYSQTRVMLPQVPTPLLPEGVEHSLSECENASQSTGITLVFASGFAYCGKGMVLDNGAHQSQLDLDFAEQHNLPLRYLNQHVGLANGALHQVAELAEDVSIIVCRGTLQETCALKKGMQVLRSVRPWFTLLIGTDISTPLGLTPMPKLSVCYYDSGYKHQSTFRIRSMHCRQPGQGPASPPLAISYVGYERARQLHAEGLRPAPVGMVASMPPELCVSPPATLSPPCAALPPVAPEQPPAHPAVHLANSTVPSACVSVLSVGVPANDMYPSLPPPAQCALGVGATLPACKDSAAVLRFLAWRGIFPARPCLALVL